MATLQRTHHAEVGGKATARGVDYLVGLTACETQSECSVALLCHLQLFLSCILFADRGSQRIVSDVTQFLIE